MLPDRGRSARPLHRGTPPAARGSRSSRAGSPRRGRPRTAAPSPSARPPWRSDTTHRDDRRSVRHRDPRRPASGSTARTQAGGVPRESSSCPSCSCPHRSLRARCPCHPPLLPHRPHGRTHTARTGAAASNRLITLAPHRSTVPHRRPPPSTATCAAPRRRVPPCRSVHVLAALSTAFGGVVRCSSSAGPSRAQARLAVPRTIPATSGRRNPPSLADGSTVSFRRWSTCPRSPASCWPRSSWSSCPVRACSS